MTSTELKIGMTNSARPSSRVLKPPGGGHTNIFGEPDVAVNAPRPKYNQQNSSNLNACMGSTDANHAVEKLRDEVVVPKQAAENASATAGAGGRPAAKQANNNNNAGGNNNNGTNGGGGRVPPGGYSSGGFW